MNMEAYLIKQSKAEREFVGDTLFDAVDKLAMRRGQQVEEIAQPGQTVECSTGDSRATGEEHISFEATYAHQDEANFGFIYELVKSECMTEEFADIPDDQIGKVIALLESDDTECLPEQAAGLLKLIEAYLTREAEIDLPYRVEYRFTCRANQVGSSMLVERAVLTYLDGILITQTSIGSVDLDDVESDEEDEGDDNKDPELAEDEERVLDLSTATLEDITELYEMLTMLGLADRKP